VASEALTLDDFDFALPPDRIAQEPAVPRDSARLLVLDRRQGALRDQRVSDLTAWLGAGDCLVVNDTRVMPARLLGRVEGTGREIEALLLAPDGGRGSGPGADDEREVLLRPARHCPPGTALVLGDGAVRAVVTARGEAGRAHLRFEAGVPVADLLARHGRLPLPPYLRHYRQPTSEDWARYQTVYAENPGAVAAPTAGLHFTPALLARLAAHGVEVHRVTLHVGPGTFRPVRAARVSEHRMEGERYDVPAATAAAVNRARREGRRVVAVGTTTVRTLETAARANDPDRIAGGSGWTDLTILPGVPGHRFRAVDALLTNFHLPRSSLLLLVAAFAGREPILEAYRHAVAAGYRFYSYGDAMLIL
jgi:S-adenosylmethionine:tRNA ribosyltransferase-isomerase